MTYSVPRIMQLTKILFVFVLLFGAFSAQATYTELYPALTKTVSGDLNFTIYCTEDLTITKVYQRYGAQTAGTVFDLILPTQTVRATTTGTTGFLEFNFTGQPCSSSIPATLDFISGDSSWSWYRLPTAPHGTTPPYNQMTIYADASEDSYWFPQGYDYTLTANNTTTYVPVSQYVTDLECYNYSPTTTCAFTYSTTTATTADYTSYFDYITFFLGIILFGLALLMFKGLITKYL